MMNMNLLVVLTPPSIYHIGYTAFMNFSTVSSTLISMSSAASKTIVSYVVPAPSIWLGWCVLDLNGLHHGLHLMDLDGKLFLIALHWICSMVHLCLLNENGNFNCNWLLLKYPLDSSPTSRTISAWWMTASWTVRYVIVVTNCMSWKMFESYPRLLHGWHAIQFTNG